jgi:hypothetical protein
MPSAGKHFFLCALTLGSLMGLAAGGALGDEPSPIATVAFPGEQQPDLWLLGGQSNMAGYGIVKEVFEPTPDIRFFASNKTWVIGKDPGSSLFYPHGNPQLMPDPTKSSVRGTGPALFFARHLRKYVNRPIGIIGVATGRSLPKMWDPDLGTKGDQFGYAKMVEWIKLAGGYGKLKGMVWYQGESDAQEFPSDSQRYEENLAKLVGRLRRDTGNPDLPVIVVQICRVVNGYAPGTPGKSGGGEEMTDAFATYSRAWETVREAQRQLAERHDHVFLVSAADLYPMTDPIHLDYEAFERLAPRIGEVALSQIYKLPGHATPIALESIKLGETLDDHTHQPVGDRSTIRVRFRGVNGKLHAAGSPSGFELRFPETAPERRSGPVIYRVDFDPTDPAVLLLRATGGINCHVNSHLVYGGGMNPTCNIADDKDIPLPAFGPLKVGR